MHHHQIRFLYGFAGTDFFISNPAIGNYRRTGTLRTERRERLRMMPIGKCRISNQISSSYDPLATSAMNTNFSHTFTLGLQSQQKGMYFSNRYYQRI